MRGTVYYILILILFATNLSCNSKSRSKKEIGSDAKQTTGKVIGIVDGDTYDILMEGNKTVRIRMEGIDAPEKGMPFYKVAKTHLSDLCFGQQVTLKITGKDHHDRTLAFSYMQDGTELSHEMLKAGLAWHFKEYNSDTDLAQLETEARKSKLGLWQDEKPMTPWENRALHRNGVSTKDSFDIKKGQH